MNKPVMKIQLTSGPLDHLIEMGEGIDVRLDEERWQVLQVGDIIEFEEDPSAEQKEIIRATILERFDTDIGTDFLNFLAFCIGEADTSPETVGNYELSDGTSVPFRTNISQDPAKPTVLIS